MSYFRHPKTQSERKGDQAIQYDDDAPGIKPKGRVRSGKKGKALPTERDDKVPAAYTDRSRGKKSHSPARKAKTKVQDDLFK